tara:strand:- start:7195 stop:7578 length:384 start_codon:yes stop_codon:yes gene_type:complete
MKHFLISIALLLFTTNLLAHGDKHDEHAKKLETISGQLIGLTCFVKHQSKGEGHIDCFKECAEKGLPIGVLTKDNQIYQISGEGHTDLKETNKQFLKYAEKDVVVKGEIFKGHNLNMVVVKGIKLSK